jgi:hypothetical protein
MEKNSMSRLIGEDQVSASYDGYGWYRKTFIADPLMKNKKNVLILGKN